MGLKEREIMGFTGLERDSFGFRSLERGRNGLGVLGLKKDIEWGLRD